MPSPTLEKLRLRFWLAAMDGIDGVPHLADGALHRAYLFAVRRASEATDWGALERIAEEVDRGR